MQEAYQKGRRLDAQQRQHRNKWVSEYWERSKPLSSKFHRGHSSIDPPSPLEVILLSHPLGYGEPLEP